MQDLTAKRTLVKSPPELWNELSEVERLARHLDAFGEIKITKLEPEHTVAWEGEGASGTVSIEPSGWGTKVTLTAHVDASAGPAEAAPPPPEIADEPDPADSPETAAVKDEDPEEPPAVEPAPEPEAAPRGGLFARLFGRRTPPPPVAEEAGPIAEEVQPRPAAEQVQSEPISEPVLEEPAPDPVADEAAAEEHTPDSEPDDRGVQAILDDVLDALGSAHHRPFSRG
jgi:hypothetical protein